MGSSSGGRPRRRPTSPDLSSVEIFTDKKAGATKLARMFSKAAQERGGHSQESFSLHVARVTEALQGSFPLLEINAVESLYSYSGGLSGLHLLIDVAAETRSGGSDVSTVLDQVADTAQAQMPDALVRIKDTAVSVQSDDGCELLLLPAVPDETGYLIPDQGAEGWIHSQPIAFRHILEGLDDRLGGNFTRVLQIAKHMCRVAQIGVSPYYLEQLAIRALLNYTGFTTDLEMLHSLFNKAKNLVLQPLAKLIDEGVEVDGYDADPTVRRDLARQFRQLEDRIVRAKDDPIEWKSLLGSQ